MPKHHHGAINYVLGYSGGSQSAFSTILAGSAGGDGRPAVKDTGGGKAHENMPPYKTLYYWLRTA